MVNQADFISVAVREAMNGIQKGHGGPFGSVIVKDGKIISKAHNEVVKRNDPTAHAEVLAIRKAGTKTGSFHLEGCSIYSTCEPCPMCLSAILWARIDQCYYVCSRQDAENIGFDDNRFYEFLNGHGNLADFKLLKIDHRECLHLFDTYKSLKNKILY